MPESLNHQFFVFSAIVRTTRLTQIIHNDFNSLALLENVWMREFAVDCRVHGICTCGHRGVEDRYFRGDVGDVVEESTISR